MKPLRDSLFRSIIRFKQEEERHLSDNLSAIRSEFSPIGLDGHILAFITEIYDKTHAVPAYPLLRQRYQDLETSADGHGTAGVVRLEGVAELANTELLPFLSGPEFRYELDKFKDEVTRESLGTILVEASTILTTGVRRRERGQDIMVVGPGPTFDFLADNLAKLSSSLRRGAIEGTFRNEAAAIRRQYELWKAEPANTVGVLTGIDKFDLLHRGIRKGELGLVLGFVSHMKTSFVINWLYRAAIYFGKNAAIASMETPIEDLRVIIYVMHSAHERFRAAGYQPLDYDKVTTGSLTTEEENLFEMVIDDFEKNPEYGEIYFKEPEDVLSINEIRRWAEDRHKQTPLDLLVIDYLGLVDPDRDQSSLDSGANLNKVLRSAKMMAMTFGKGDKIAVVSPHQANRDGLKEAQKNGGRYTLTALANANESERSTDIIYYTYVDDALLTSREILLGNLKARKRQRVTEPFKAYSDPATWVIGNLDEGVTTADLVTI